MDIINQKEYLKKYLSKGDKKKKKKLKKKPEISGATVKIIDDDTDFTFTVEEDVEDEDAPQIVGVIDERPLHMRVDDYRKTNLWKPLGASTSANEDSQNSDLNRSPIRIKIKEEPKDDIDIYLNEQRNRKQNALKKKRNREDNRSNLNDVISERNEEDFSPRVIKIEVDDDLSPPRRNPNEEDLSPPRRNLNEGDLSPPRRNDTANSDLSPPRKNRKVDDLSPPRKDRRREPSSSRGNRKHDDRSPSRRSTSDRSPSRKRTRDSSPPRRSRNRDYSPHRNRRDENSDSKNSDFRTERKETGRDRESRWEAPKPRKLLPGDKKGKYLIPAKRTENAKMQQTLDGKTAGLQNAQELVKETESFRQRENEMFKNLPSEVSGVGAATVLRDRRTGKIRDLEKEAEEKKEKERKEEEKKEQYMRWGKGLKQVEDYNEKLQQDLHEMNKPLARYADDEDLEKFLKEQEREGDPMLAYLRKKKKKVAVESGKPLKPEYEGEFMPNRYGIRPGHRWDGVDRSSGYERKWFETQNAKRAQLEDMYKWSTEDM